MKKLVGVLMIAVLAAECAGSVSSRWRRADAGSQQQDSGVFAILETAMGIAESMPIAGGFIESVVNWVLRLFYAMEDVTNGGFARFMGGALPCEMSLKRGIQCTGITSDNNLASQLMKVFDETPMPNLLKMMMENVLKTTLDPVMNMAFGGVPIIKR